MVLLAPLLLAGALANDVAAATPEPTAATPAPTPAPTPEKETDLGKPRGHTKNGIPIYKIPGSTNKGCQSFATIMLAQTFEQSAMNETAAVKRCAHDCGTFYNSAAPELLCTGFEVKDIPGNDIPGVQCTLWKGPCKLADGTDDNIRGQYQIPPQSRFSTTQIAAAAAFLLLLGSVVYFMYPRKAPDTGAKRGLKKPGHAEGSEATEDIEGHPLMGLEGHPGHAIALAAIAPEHRHWVEHHVPGSEKDLAERSHRFEVLTSYNE